VAGHREYGSAQGARPVGQGFGCSRKIIFYYLNYLEKLFRDKIENF
jgi:hypothetical protein